MKKSNHDGLPAVAAWARLLALAVLVVVMPGAPLAQSADLKVLTSGAPSEAARQVAEKFTAATGQKVVISVATVGVIRKRLAGGEKPDIVLLPTPVIDALEHAGMLVAGSQVELARVGIGVVVREGASLPDVSTADAVRKTLLAASSIVYPDPVGGGLTGAHLAGVMEQLGIADALKPKTTLLFAIGGGVTRVAEGKSELGLFNISEILPVKGVTLVGPLPSALQSYITFSAAFHVGTAAGAPAAAFVQALSDPSAGDAWHRSGLEPLAQAH